MLGMGGMASRTGSDLHVFSKALTGGGQLDRDFLTTAPPLGSPNNPNSLYLIHPDVITHVC